MSVLTMPPMSAPTSRLIDRAVDHFDAELKPFVALIRSGQPIPMQLLADEMQMPLEEILPFMVRAVEALGRVIRSLEIDDGERQEILRWLSMPRSQPKTMSFSEVLSRFHAMDAT